VRTDASRETPNLQGFFLPYCLTEAPLEAFEPYCHGISFAFYVTRPTSRGHIALASADPLDAPVIDPAYRAIPQTCRSSWPAYDWPGGCSPARHSPILSAGSWARR
jgi:choline dehydrogenase-like flavoprotein